MYFHQAQFDKAKSAQKKVRLALVWRWLSVPKYFRQSLHDNSANRYSMIDKHAFEKIEGFELGRSPWRKALGYGNGDCIKNLMDPIIK